MPPQPCVFEDRRCRLITLAEGRPGCRRFGFGCNNFGHNPFGNFVGV